jgi:hypothetical protein
LDNLLHTFPVNTGHVYVVAVFGDEASEGGRVMAVPRDCVFGENIAYNTFIIFVVRGAVISAIVKERGVSVSVTIITIPVSVAGVVGRIRIVGRIGILRIFVGPVCVVAPVPSLPRTPWKAEVPDEDDFIETVGASKAQR